MSCPRNPKVFLVFAYDGPCEYSPTRIEASGSDGEFHIYKQCVHCKSKSRDLFIKQREMVRAGYDADKLNSMKQFESRLPENLRENT